MATSNNQEEIVPSYEDILSELVALKARDRAFFKAATDVRKMLKGDSSIDFNEVINSLREDYRNAT